MPLTVHKLAPRCETPPPLAAAARRVESLVRERLAAELGARLGPSLDADPAVVRIRRLPLRVVLRGPNFDDATVLEAWLQAFVDALFRALAYPSGQGPFEQLRWNTRAEQLAELTADALAGTASSQWQWSEWVGSSALEDPRRILDLCNSATELRALLAVLEARGLLQALVLRFDDLKIEELFTTLGSSAGPAALTIDVVVSVSRLAAAWSDETHAAHAIARATSGGSTALGVRRVALRLYAFAAGRAGELPPRAIFQALLTLVVLTKSTPDHPELTLPPAVAAFVARVRSESTAGNTTTGLPTTLATLVHEGAASSMARSILPPGLNEAVAAISTLLAPSPVPLEANTEESPWISSECTGVLLLLPWAQRLGWANREPFELAAISQHVVQADAIDPAVALFSGCIGDFDHAGFRRYRQGSDQGEIERRALELVDAFRARIRGFRKSPAAAIVRQFLRQPGRFRVEDRRITIVLDPAPAHVALHLSSLDEPVPSLSWLGGRSLEFVLGGLA
jgi:hypothetical protein